MVRIISPQVSLQVHMVKPTPCSSPLSFKRNSSEVFTLKCPLEIWISCNCLKEWIIEFFSQDIKNQKEEVLSRHCSKQSWSLNGTPICSCYPSLVYKRHKQIKNRSRMKIGMCVWHQEITVNCLENNVGGTGAVVQCLGFRIRQIWFWILDLFLLTKNSVMYFLLSS